LFVLKKVRGTEKVKALNAGTVESLFILIFGVFHFALPFILTPNPNTTINVLVTLHISDFVVPGCFALAIFSVIFYVRPIRYLGLLLAFLYSGGITFHLLFFLGLVGSVIVVPTNLILAAGIPVDAVAILAVYDYYRRSVRLQLLSD
jgi:hypothetical protein